LELIKLKINKNKTNVTTLVYFILTFLFLYPVTIILTSYFFGENKFIPNAVMIISTVSLGYIAGYISCNWNLLKKIAFLCLIFAIVLLISIYINNTGLGYLLYQIFSVSIFYVLGIRLFFTEPFSTAIRTGIVLLLIALSISYYSKDFLYLKNTFFIFTNLYLFLAVAMKSQENLKDIFQQRGIQASEIQRKIQKNNVKLIGFFFLCVILLFNMKKIVMALLNITKFVLSKILWLIAMIIQLLYKEQQTTDEPVQNVKPFMPEPGPSKESILSTIANIIICLLLLYAAYRLLPLIIRKIKETVISIIEKLKLFFHYKTKENIRNNNECIDYIEIKKLSESTLKKQKNKALKKINKRKLLKQAKNPVEKVRFLYAVILEELSKKIIIKESDTTGEICNKSLEAQIVSQDFKDITHLYDSVRYGEKIPKNNEVSVMENYYFKNRHPE